MARRITKRSKKHSIWQELEHARTEISEASNRSDYLEAQISQIEEDSGRLACQVLRAEERVHGLTRERERLLLLLNLTQDLATLDTRRILTTITTKLPVILGARKISLYLYDADRHELKLKGHNHAHQIDPVIALTDSPTSLMAEAVQNRKALLVANVARFKGRRRASGRGAYKTPSCLVAPIVHGDQVLGVVNLADRYDGSPFDRSDQEVIERAALLIALALETAFKVDGLRNASLEDPLTGLRNKRSLVAALDIEVKRATRYDADLSLVVLDLDDFGWINGNYGYPAGDAILAQIGRFLRNNIREVDIPGRLDADEFGLILPEQSAQGAIVVARRLESLLSTREFRIGEHSLKAPATFGVAQFATGDGYFEILRAAEEACLQARRRGERIGVRT